MSPSSQVAMGITTLLLYVPVPVAAAHQSGALVSIGKDILPLLIILYRQPSHWQCGWLTK